VILHLRFRTVQHWYSRSRSIVPRRSAPSAARWARPETSMPCRQWTPSESTSPHRGVETAFRDSLGSCCTSATCSTGRSASAGGCSDMAATAPRDWSTSMPPGGGGGSGCWLRRRVGVGTEDGEAWSWLFTAWVIDWGRGEIPISRCDLRVVLA
jgi:hypothetical protein